MSSQAETAAAYVAPLGTVRKGCEVGKVGTMARSKYVYVLCPKCLHPRWVGLSSYRKKPRRLCDKCAQTVRIAALLAFRQKLAGVLTTKQLGVLGLIGEGKTNKEIAFELGVAKGTVGHYCDRIFKKLGVNNRVSAVMRFHGGR